MAVIELRDVTRRFGDLTAVDAVTLDVEEGEIVGLLGHNGAGKTTLMRLINGLLRPDGGWLRVHGRDPSVDGLEVRQRTGVLTEYPALEGYLSVNENLEVFASINGVDQPTAAARIGPLLDRLGLAEKAFEPARELSAGLKQRVALARALLHEPTLLLLDEPTTNMDPVAAREVRGLVRTAARDHGRTVLLSTHNLPEAEELCDRIAIMREGRLLVDGAPSQLRRDLARPAQVRITTDPDRGSDLIALVRAQGLPATSIGDSVLAEGDDDRLDVPRLVEAAVQAGIPIHRVDPCEATLEDLYVAMHVPVAPPASAARA